MTARHSANLGCPSELTRLSMMKIPRLFSDVHLEENTGVSSAAFKRTEWSSKDDK